jgi:hypothetical protein
VQDCVHAIPLLRCDISDNFNEKADITWRLARGSESRRPSRLSILSHCYWPVAGHFHRLRSCAGFPSIQLIRLRVRVGEIWHRWVPDFRFRNGRLCLCRTSKSLIDSTHLGSTRQAMHRALHAPDLLGVVFRSFSSPVRPRDLLNAALVCLVWSEPALRILWDNDSFGRAWVRWRDIIKLSSHVFDNKDVSDVRTLLITSIRY